MISRRLALAGMAAFAATPAFATEVRLMSPADAHEQRQAGSVALVDVREPVEWADGGVAEGANLIAMRDPDILAKFELLTGGDKTAPLALICRTGARSGYIAAELAKRGYTNVYSVNGGMLGSASGTGWRRAGLPVTTVQ